MASRAAEWLPAVSTGRANEIERLRSFSLFFNLFQLFFCFVFESRGQACWMLVTSLAGMPCTWQSLECTGTLETQPSMPLRASETVLCRRCKLHLENMHIAALSLGGAYRRPAETP